MPNPTPKFTMIGKGTLVHTVHSKAYDLKNSGCQSLRKAVVAGKIDYRKGKFLSPEAALSLDGCTHCGTEAVAKRMLPAETKRANAKDKRDDVLKRAKGDKPKKVKAAKVKAEPKPRKESKPTKTKAGMRSVGSSTDAKAEALRLFCADNGWMSEIAQDKATGHTVVKAVSGDMVIEAYFIDGKYDVARHATITVGSWQGTLRGAHAVRRQVDRDLDSRDRPHPQPGKGRTGPRTTKGEDEVVPEDESPEDAARRVPFLLDDDDVVIIDAIKGKKVRWRNGISGVIEEAVVPSEVKSKNGKRPKIRIQTHPTTGKRILDFLAVDSVTEDGEVLGQERCVSLEKIVRVVG